MACGAGLVAPATASAGPGSGAGGAFSSAPAKIRSVSCVARCATTDAAKPGSLVRVRGTRMQDVAKIVFLAGGGHQDNTTARVSRARRNSVDVTVPQKASSGRLRAINADGARSKASRALISVRRGTSRHGLDVRVVGRRVYLGAARRARVDLLARRTMTVSVALVRVLDGAIVMAWPLALVAETPSSVTWDGRVGGTAQPTGRYEFRVFESPACARVRRSAMSARRVSRTAATCTSSCGAGWHSGGEPLDPEPSLKAWDAYS